MADALAIDSSPAWQCPRCQIAYAKFVADALMHVVEHHVMAAPRQPT